MVGRCTMKGEPVVCIFRDPYGYCAYHAEKCVFWAIMDMNIQSKATPELLSFVNSLDDEELESLRRIVDERAINETL
jgi:hypothetical protein